MKAYSYDYAGLYIGDIECDLCQITELLKQEQQARGLAEGEAPIESVVLLPNFSTLIAPEHIDGHDSVFIDGVWTYPIKVIPEPKEEPVPYVPTYKDFRADAYPSFYEYLDGVVKMHSEDLDVHTEGSEQVEKYISDCLAVKVKYPKPSGV